LETKNLLSCGVADNHNPLETINYIRGFAKVDKIL